MHEMKNNSRLEVVILEPRCMVHPKLQFSTPVIRTQLDQPANKSTHQETCLGANHSALIVVLPFMQVK
ncbi:MAG TPA: hypothetical protein VI776_01965 [Anaerolineales bacterium]|jgi:hypothetical protein|nr:hypothetical protein [Anaerolineales bacterium]